MDKQNFYRLESELEKRQKVKEKRKRKRMAVSGGSVKKLAGIIIAKKYS